MFIYWCMSHVYILVHVACSVSCQVKEQLTQAMFDHIPVGVGSQVITSSISGGVSPECRVVVARAVVGSGIEATLVEASNGTTHHH